MGKALARKKFQPYKPEKPKAARPPKVKENKVLSQLRKAFEKMEDADPQVPDGYYDEADLYYETALRSLSRLSYTPEDIRSFCIALSDFQRSERFPIKAGTFLSALINKGQHKHYQLNIDHLPALNFLGYHLGSKGKRILIVDGDVDASSFYKMENSHVILNGSAEFCICDHAKGGVVIVKGNCGEGAGECMSGGILIIHGDVGPGLGDGAQNVTIKVYGNAEHVGLGTDLIHPNENVNFSARIFVEGDICTIGSDSDLTFDGTIYHKGKPVYDAGDNFAQVELLKKLGEVCKDGNYTEFLKNYRIVRKKP